jgi:DNA-binding MarR family transcriptional regulator
MLATRRESGAVVGTASRGNPTATAGLLLEAVPPLVRLLRGALREGAGPVTLTQARILARLEAGPRLVGELAAAMEVRAPTASVAVDSLVRRGLVARLADQADRRVVRVTLTAQGRQVLEVARRRQLDVLAGLLGALGEDELRGLEQGLRGLARIRSGPDRTGARATAEAG